MASSQKRSQRAYDHRLRELVCVTGDVNIVSAFGVPRSTAVGWLRRDHRPVVTGDVLEMDTVQLQAEVLKLRQYIRRLGAVVRLLLALCRTLGWHLERTRLPEGPARARLVRAIERAQPALSLKSALQILHLSPSRYHQWRQAERVCGIAKESVCPRITPTRLTPDEVLAIKTMVESPQYRHVSTGRLAVLAQRLRQKEVESSNIS